MTNYYGTPCPNCAECVVCGAPNAEEISELEARHRLAEHYANKDCWAMFEEAWERGERV